MLLIQTALSMTVHQQKNPANLRALVASLPVLVRWPTWDDRLWWNWIPTSTRGSWWCIEYIEGMISDGFYTVSDTENPPTKFQAAVIASVEKVTHIAPATQDDREARSLVQTSSTRGWRINYPMKKLGLCGGVTDCSTEQPQRFTQTATKWLTKSVMTLKLLL